MLKKLICLFCGVILTCALLTAAVSAATAEQVQITMPNVDLYFYADGEDLSQVRTGDVTATLGGEALTVDGLSRDQQGVFYVYLLDVSGSIPDSHFDAALQAVKDARTRLRSQDKLALISFGSEVRLLLQGGETAEEADAVLDGLQNTDKNTMFYTAMDELISFLDETSDMRRVAVVVSDGIDDTDAGVTQEELEQTLLRSGISVSALCIDTASAEDVAQFRSLLQISGGELYPFSPEDASATLESLLDRLSGGYLLELSAPNNLASGTEETLRADFGQGTVLELAVTPEDWVPDETPPAVLSASWDQNSGTIAVKFTEAVQGGDQPEHYVLTCSDGAVIPVSTAESADGVTFAVTPSEALPENQDVTLTLCGITDVSMEQNPVAAFRQVVSTGTPSTSSAASAAAAAAETSAGAAEEPLLSTGTILLLAAAAAAAAVAVVVIVRLSGGPKRKAEKPPREPKAKKPKKKDVKASSTFVFLDDEHKDAP
ncbi:MAG: VWA domain-containing protein [Oscillospiraceae bacterium]|nr:VWA domain-containing protein [Oscillospiraceae bacterium]